MQAYYISLRQGDSDRKKFNCHKIVGLQNYGNNDTAKGREQVHNVLVLGCSADIQVHES